MTSEATPSRSAALFLQLVLGLQQQGMVSLGKLMNPFSRKIEVHPDTARDTIDLLAALEARTKGNLEPDEERVLRQTLSELRMNYLDVVKRQAGGPAAEGGDA